MKRAMNNEVKNREAKGPMNSIKGIGFVLLVLGIMLGSGYMAFFQEKTDERGAYIAEAEELSSKDFHRDAIVTYKKVLELNPEDKEVQRKVAHEYLLAGDGQTAASLSEELLSRDAGDASLYRDMICGYLVSNDIAGAISKVKKAREVFPEDPEIRFLYERLRGTYEETIDQYSRLTEFRDGYALGRDMEGRLRLIDADEHEYPKKVYPEEIDDYVVVQENGQDMLLISIHDDAASKGGYSCRYVDGDGYLRVSPKGNYLFLGCPRDGRSLFRDKKGWGYLDENLQDMGVRFEEATAFAEGIAAVKEKDGWRLVTPDTIRKSDSSMRYAEVVMDLWKVCSTSGGIFVRTEQGYVLVSSKGDVLSEVYEDVRTFTEKGGVAAVRKNGKWGLIDGTGKEVCEAKYDELCSGGDTLIAYRQGNLWGYMDRTGDVYVEPAFQSAGTMSRDGTAFVTKQENEGKEVRPLRIQMNILHEEDDAL